MENNEALLQLLAAAIGYINERETPKNPFVKSFKGADKTDEAYAFLVDCVYRCEAHLPELRELGVKRLEALQKEDISSYED